MVFWIRIPIEFTLLIRIRIRIENADPDPEALKLTKKILLANLIPEPCIDTFVHREKSAELGAV
jgi:hypothetical protein